MPKYQIAHKLSKVEASATLAITTKAAELRQTGKDVISLSAGEPDFATPEHICQAAINAINSGKTKYTAVDGVPELKQAIVEKFAKDNNLSYSTNEVMASTGAKQTVFNAIMATVNEGDEVIIPAPYWVSYPSIVKLMMGKPVIISCDISSKFKVTATELEKYITKKTKLIILNSPSNPTGAVYTESELREIASLLEKHPQVLVLSDDIYEHIILGDEPFVNLLQVAPNLRDRIIVSNGVSKAYAMTGWRIGFVAAVEPYIKTMKKIQSQSTANPSSISQYATIAALTGPQDMLAKMLSAFKERHQLVMDRIADIKCIHAEPSAGAFYSFIDISQAMEQKNIATDEEFCKRLLEENLVATVPGVAFGTKKHLRVSFATSIEQLNLAFDRIANFVA